MSHTKIEEAQLAISDDLAIEGEQQLQAAENGVAEIKKHGNMTGAAQRHNYLKSLLAHPRSILKKMRFKYWLDAIATSTPLYPTEGFLTRISLGK